MAGVVRVSDVRVVEWRSRGGARRPRFTDLRGKRSRKVQTHASSRPVAGESRMAIVGATGSVRTGRVRARRAQSVVVREARGARTHRQPVSSNSGQASSLRPNGWAGSRGVVPAWWASRAQRYCRRIDSLMNSRGAPGRWRAESREVGKLKGLTRIPGCSWIEKVQHRGWRGVVALTTPHRGIELSHRRRMTFFAS